MRMFSRIATFGLLVATTLFLAASSKHAFTSPPTEVHVIPVEQRDAPITKEWGSSLDGFLNAQIRAQIADLVGPSKREPGEVSSDLISRLKFVAERQQQELAVNACWDAVCVAGLISGGQSQLTRCSPIAAATVSRGNIARADEVQPAPRIGPTLH